MPIDVVCALEPVSRARELKRRLEPSNVIVAANATEIDTTLGRQGADMVIAGTRVLRPPVERWIREIRDLPDEPDVVLVHDDDDAEYRAAAIRAGCLAVLGGALSMDDLAATVKALIQRRLNLARLVHATTPLSESRLEDFVSLSPRMQELVVQGHKLAKADSSLLLQGETGTGKERLARALHRQGPRSAHPFVAVNCGALPENLIESELFGHEKGAFTGAERTRRGYFELADGGTLFLDEIGELPQPAQVRLLRVLEERRVQRLGAERSFPIDIRVMAASNRDLEQEVEAGRFREDLYYRLAVVTLTVPPLRHRQEDIPALFESHLDAFRSELNRPIYGVEAAALEALVRYRWPGNVRELINVAERAVLLGAGPEIGMTDLPKAISTAPPDSGQGTATFAQPAAWVGKPLVAARQHVVDDFEQRYLRHLLRETGGSVGETARRAGLAERTLFELMRRHRLRKEEFRGLRNPSGDL